MVRWIPYAFVRIVFFFAGGILLAVFHPNILPAFHASLTFIVLVLIYGVFFVIGRIRKRRFSFAGIFGLSAVCFAGYIHLLNSTGSSHPDHFMHTGVPLIAYEAVITSGVEEKAGAWKAEAEVVRVCIGPGEWLPQEGKLILYFDKKDFASPFAYGDVLLIKGSPSVVEGPANPGEFDYREYLSFRNIYHQHFLRGDLVQWVGNHPPNVVFAMANRVRTWAITCIEKNVSDAQQQGIALALVLGVTSGIDSELRQAYATTGTMHVLAVSGLHVSIIYMIILTVLKPLNRSSAGKWMLATVSLILLWGYAFVTGLSASVLRAVTMFSFLAVARAWGKSTNIYNTLAASAFCILMYDPFMIMHVGFQLSYLAVIGIVSLQPDIYRLWEPDNRLLDEVWKMSSVTLAAQVATSPIGMLYFHQFPNYFLLSNLLVVPGSFVVLVTGLALLAFSFSDTLAAWIGWLLGWSIEGINTVIFAIESLPFSRIDDILLTPFQCWLLSAAIVAIILLFKQRKLYFLLWACAFLLIMAISQFFYFQEKINIDKLTVYHVRGHTAIDFISRGFAGFYTDTVLRSDPGSMANRIQPNRVISGVRNVVSAQEQGNVHSGEGITVIVWRGKVIVHLHQANVLLPGDIKIDYLVVGNNAIRDLSVIPSPEQYECIILDSSNSFYIAERLVMQARRLGLSNLHSVLHEGAFDMTIEKIDI